MNKTLLTKWLVRFNDHTIVGKWKDILQAKYFISSSSLSHFWAAVLKHKDLVNLDFNKTIGSYKTVMFWPDRWIGECALSSIFPLLYFITLYPQITVNNDFVHNIINIEFKRQLVRIYLNEWNSLLSVIDRVTINPSLTDIYSWR
jgi:hypothetical protein